MVLVGNWKSIDELESSISYKELEVLANAMREREHREFKRMAALKGISLDDDEEKDTPFDRVKRKVDEQIKEQEASRRGLSDPEYVDLQDMGVGVEEW